MDTKKELIKKRDSLKVENIKFNGQIEKLKLGITLNDKLLEAIKELLKELK